MKLVVGSTIHLNPEMEKTTPHKVFVHGPQNPSLANDSDLIEAEANQLR